MIPNSAQEIAASKKISIVVPGALLTVFLIVVTVPFFSGSTSPVGQAVSESLLLILIALVAINAVTRKRASLSFSNVEIIGILFLVSAMAASVTSIYPVAARNSLGLIILLGLVFFVSVKYLSDNFDVVWILFFSLLVSGLIQSIIALHQLFFLSWYESALPEFFAQNLVPNLRGGVLRVVGGFINPNYFAGFMNICLAVTGAVALFGKITHFRRIKLAAASLLFLAVIILSGSKGGLIASGLVLATLLFIKDKRFVWIFIVLIVLLAVVPNPVRDQLIRAVTADPFIKMRPGIWNDAVQVSLDSPVFGVGPGNFAFASHKYAPATDFLLVHHGRFPRIAHNTFLHGMAEFGIVGVLPLFILILLFIIASVKSLVRINAENENWPLILGLSLGLLAVFLHSVVDNVANNRAVLIVLIFICAALAAYYRNSFIFNVFKTRISFNVPVAGNAIAVVGVSLLLLAFFTMQVFMPLNYELSMERLNRLVNGEIDQLRMVLADDDVRKDLKLTAIHKNLEKLQQESVELAALYPENIAVNRLNGLIHRQLFTITGKMNHVIDAIHYYRQAGNSVNGHSRSDDYYQLIVYFDLVSRGYPKTEEILNTMLDLVGNALENWPTRAVFHHAAYTIARERGEYNDAVAHLQRAIELEPNFLQAIFDQARIAIALNDEELKAKAEELYGKALKRISSGPAPGIDDSYALQILNQPHN